MKVTALAYSDDENVRYKLNKNYLDKNKKSIPKIVKKHNKSVSNKTEDDIHYKFPTVLLTKTKMPTGKLGKSKPTPKIKVNFWNNKSATNQQNNVEGNKQKTNRRHTIGASAQEGTKPKNTAVTVRKRVSFLPSPLFSDNHVPMVTVPDDLTINFNEEEANDLADDLNQAFVKNISSNNDSENSRKGKSKTNSSNNQLTKGEKRKKGPETSIYYNEGNDNVLEFFSKYVALKLRKMETNQRIYSENLINTVLMYGQLGKLNGKSKIGEI